MGGPRLTIHMRDVPDTVDVRIDELDADIATNICGLLPRADAPVRPAEEQSGEPRPLALDEVRVHLGRRVLAVTKDGDRSRGVLARATAERLVLDPPEDGADVIPFPRLAKVVPLGPRADGGIWTLTANGLRPVYPALGRKEEDRG
ncbi:hypothetical protein [Actinomadura sp. CNU-125]|uniref:hypothetical protein n=1 Tax=Actinomadura sp. CNU-125 TaxID=1904961 RepID=UPI00117832E5|nr:hypothetical protein [Actinomadura sp. CNU-125]